MQARKTLEELFVNDAWKGSLTNQNIKRILDEFYLQVGDKRAELFAESLEDYKANEGQSYLSNVQKGIKDYAFVLLTCGIVGPSVRKTLNPGFVVYLKANQVLSHLEIAAMRKNYNSVDYKDELENLSDAWIKHVFGH